MNNKIKVEAINFLKLVTGCHKNPDYAECANYLNRVKYLMSLEK